MSAQRPFSRINRCRQFIDQRNQLRQLLMSYPITDTKRIRENLHWYGLSVNALLNTDGLLRVLAFNIANQATDPNAVNHGIDTLYYQEIESAPNNQPNPSVWNFRGLSNSPWESEKNEVRRLLEDNAEILINERSTLEHDLQSMPESQLREIGIHRQEKGSKVDKQGKPVPVFTLNGAWQGMYFFDTNGKNQALTQLCPKTSELISQLHLNTAFGMVFYSDLMPGTSILPHTGGSNLRLRCHFGITVPEPSQTIITVGDESRRWSQGKCLFFDDSYMHSVEHSGKKTRTILNIDLWHPNLKPHEIDILSKPVFSQFGKSTEQISLP